MTEFDLPEYYAYYNRPVKFVATTDGAMAVWKLSWNTGGWEPAEELVDEIAHDAGGEVSRLTRDQFIDLTERTRAKRRLGNATIGALHETAQAILDQARHDNRPLTDEEQALVKEIFKHTYQMFEATLASHGDPGAGPGAASGGAAELVLAGATGCSLVDESANPADNQPPEATTGPSTGFNTPETIGSLTKADG